MAEPLSLIDNNNNNNNNNNSVSENSCGESSFRRIEFHLASKPFTGFNDFSVETLNNNNNINNNNNNQQSVGLSGKKRDASELLDQELSFQITIRRIGAGLENLGNTCFLNSVLQCLTYTEPLAAYLQSGKHQVTCRKSGFCALCAIQSHVSRALQLPGRSLAPKDLVSNLRCISRTFRNSRQEDAHEYMVNLLESMHKCCLPKEVPTESQSAYDKSLVHKIFGGQLRSQVKCMQCNHCSNKFDPFLDISLEILNADSLYKAFAHFTAKEHLDGGAKAYQCQQCKQKVKALKQLTVYKAPNVLTVHLKRFGCYMSGQKIDKKVHFGPILDLKPFVTGPYDGDLKYTLYGVLVHAGWSTRSGHYYCFVRTSSGMWYALDDNRVFQVSEKTVFEQKAYMLFYFKDRNNYSSKKAKDAHQKEKIVMYGAPNGPREAEMKAGPSNHLLNAQTSLKKTADVAQQKENIVMTGAPNVLGAPREAQMKTGSSNRSLNAQTSLKETAYVAQQTENIVMNGTPNGPGAPAEAQMSNCSLNAQTSLKETADVAQQKKNIVMNGTSNGLGAATEAHMNPGQSNGLSSVAPKEAQTNTLLSTVSLNGDKSSNSVSTPNCSDEPKDAHMKTSLNDVSVNAQKSSAAVGIEGNGLGLVAPKENQMKTDLRDGSLNAQKSLAAVGTEENVLTPVAPKETQMETGLSDGSLNAQKSLAVVSPEGNRLSLVAPKDTQMETGLDDGSLNAQKSLAAVRTGGNELDPVAPKETQTDFKLNTDASEPEQTQTKETSVSKTTSEASKTEDHEKEIDEGESALLKVSDLGGKAHNTELSDLPQKGSSIKKEKKALKEKPHKKAKNLFKCKLTSMKISSNVLLGAPLNLRKKKKRKRNKQVKNLAQENLVNVCSSSFVKIQVQETVKRIVDDNGFKPRVVEDGAVLGTSDSNSGSRSNPKESNQASQKNFLHMLTRGIDERTVPRWDDDEPSQSRIFGEEKRDLAIGYIGDEWDEEYDRGKRKKVKVSKTEFDGRNPFQDIANERLKSNSQKQKSNLSKKKNKHFKESRFSNVPYRI